MLAWERPLDSVTWKLDTGSQANICGVRECFIELHTASEPIWLETMERARSKVEEIGTVELHIVNKKTGELERCHLHDVWYAPMSQVNLISWGIMRMKGYQVNDDVQMKFQEEDGIPTMSLFMPNDDGQQGDSVAEIHGLAICKKRGRTSEGEAVDMTLEHKRLAHASKSVIDSIIEAGSVQDLKIRTNDTSANDKVPFPPLRKKDKLSERATIGLLLSYSKITSGYVYLDLQSGLIHTAQRGNIKFR
ncbi:TPA: hypothetical protein N0F65_010195 [Lagenidium giganteum]|uniref:Retrovirus-related Pol polyprotein from transposon TNT 1-94-like beta-barrel domain-containing protein n=1 Tax=Lagenidium giganteum TaxID=4803 RepID=A0AAV2Z7E5_9STRA|nr:TPA: hypothetical protein N0F65_010195 [Lagenidium giganteum]